ncbi:MAG: aldehyde dehydrogenase family protein [Alphaproteobacteria bacterium]|nr:aldehyde dehydrogenase family protein [Alphaproteobacteria bacterium]
MSLDATAILKPFGLHNLREGDLAVYTPINNTEIARVKMQSVEDLQRVTERAKDAFVQWRLVPAPRRGELVRLFGQELRTHKEALGALVTLECGKILSEGLGEVQEMIDICDFAVGLSRQLYGLTIASERPGHHMRELWHPLGPVGIITAFNFPVAVWAWNAAIALVCGNSIIWKPSEKTPLCALACQKLFLKAVHRFQEAGGQVPGDLSQIVLGGRDIGHALSEHNDIPLISATGSVAMGRAVAMTVGKRLGRSLLELGGNNAAIIAPDADLDLAARAIVFGAVGTAGQRCTSLRRLIVHESVKEAMLKALVHAYERLPIGSPLKSKTLVGPLIDQTAFKIMQTAISQAKTSGGKVLTGGGRVTVRGFSGGYYVRPALIDMPEQSEIVLQETFAPILYVLTYKDLAEAIALNNAVPQGLSSSIFSLNMRACETFLSAAGSDCGIANVNIGTSGAEIGGAFGGEKETGGGRESGSDSWKSYMRRQTQTVNYSTALPLAQGVSFNIESR